MTPIKEIRLNIGDPAKPNVTSFVVDDDNIRTYQLDNENIVGITVVNKNGQDVASSNYTLNAEEGQITFNDSYLNSEDVIEIMYNYAALSDTEIQYALDSFQGNIDLASIKCLEWILASTAKLYNYKTADEDMNMSQIYKNLADFKRSLEDKVKSNGGGSRLVRLKRKDNKPFAVDISRYDAPW